MSPRRWPGRFRCSQRRPRIRFPLLILMLSACVCLTALLYMRSLFTDLSVSTAQDIVVKAVGAIVKQEMTSAAAKYGDLTTLEKNTDGQITAVTTNVSALNALAGDILLSVSEATGDNYIEISIPLGSLSGSAFLLTAGPNIRIQVQVLGSTFTGFRTDVSSVGINQTRHQILIQLRNDITLLMPWRAISTSIDTEIPVAETIIIGDVPDSYLNMGE